MKVKENQTFLKLPIKTEASITSECWTYYKLSIIETSVDANKWLASHLELYYDNNFNAYLGKFNSLFNLDYYSEILEYKEIAIEKIDPELIIEIIINELEQGNYIAVYLPHPIQVIHEIVIHGFDKNQKLLFYNGLVQGKFKEIAITFDDFKSEHDKVYIYLKSHPFSRVVTSWYFFPITRLHLKEYKDDMCLLRAIKKLTNEYDGKKIKISNPISDTNEENTYYTGLGCLIGFEERLTEYVKDQKYIKNDIFFDLSVKLVNTLFKFYEYYKNIYNTMKWISSELCGDLMLINDIVRFEHTLKDLNISYMLAIKYAQTENWSTFYNLQKKYNGIYQSFKDSLISFCNKSNALLLETKKIR